VGRGRAHGLAAWRVFGLGRRRAARRGGCSRAAAPGCVAAVTLLLGVV